MKICYIYYPEAEESASMKNSIKTCSFLAEKANVTFITSNVDVFKLKKIYNGKDNFSIITFNSILFLNKLKIFDFLNKLILCIRTQIYINKNNFDGIYTRDKFFLVFSSLFSIKIKVPLIYEVHRIFSDEIKNIAWLERRMFNRANKIFVTTEGIRNDLINKFHISNESIVIQRNCIDLEDFNLKSEDDKKIREKLGINFNDKIIIYIGSFEERKGVDVLIKAFKTLSDNFQIKLLLLGGYKREKEIIQLIKLLGLNDKIKYLGFVDQLTISDCLNISDLAVLPSLDTERQKKYTCPMKLFEYMASRVPVIASDLPTTRQIAGSSINYFRPGDYNELAEKIKQILINKNNQVKKIEEAYNIVKNGFTWDKKAEKIIEIFKIIMNK